MNEMSSFLSSSGQDDKRNVFFSEQLHLGLLHLSLVRVVLVDAPHIVGDAELLCHIAQVFVVRHDARDVARELSGLPAGQQVVEAMAHLRDEDGHAGPLVAVIEAELHLVALGIERGNVVVDLLPGNEETVQFPLYAHEEHAVLTVNILIEIDDVALVVGNKFRHF